MRKAAGSGLDPESDRWLERKQPLWAGMTRNGLGKLSSEGSLGGWRRSQLGKEEKIPSAGSEGGNVPCLFKRGINLAGAVFV